jgi:hypothetical protein
MVHQIQWATEERNHEYIRVKPSGVTFPPEIVIVVDTFEGVTAGINATSRITDSPSISWGPSKADMTIDRKS